MKSALTALPCMLYGHCMERGAMDGSNEAALKVVTGALKHPAAGVAKKMP